MRSRSAGGLLRPQVDYQPCGRWLLPFPQAHASAPPPPPPQERDVDYALIIDVEDIMPDPVHLVGCMMAAVHEDFSDMFAESWDRVLHAHLDNFPGPVFCLDSDAHELLLYFPAAAQHIHIVKTLPSCVDANTTVFTMHASSDAVLRATLLARGCMVAQHVYAL